MHNKTKVLNPPSVSRKGKKRLILDLRYVNNHLFKNKIKFDDWNSFQNYLEGNKGYLFKFDLKSGYHHVDIFEEHQTYLGFSWEINQQTHYFVFTVLPFGRSTAPCGSTINKVLTSARNKYSLFFRWRPRYRIWIFKIGNFIKIRP